MSEKEKATIGKVLENFDKMGDFQKGFVLGYAERISDDRHFEEKKDPDAESSDKTE